MICFFFLASRVGTNNKRTSWQNLSQYVLVFCVSHFLEILGTIVPSVSTHWIILGASKPPTPSTSTPIRLRRVIWPNPNNPSCPPSLHPSHTNQHPTSQYLSLPPVSLCVSRCSLSLSLPPPTSSSLFSISLSVCLSLSVFLCFSLSPHVYCLYTRMVGFSTLYRHRCVLKMSRICKKKSPDT